MALMKKELLPGLGGGSWAQVGEGSFRDVHLPAGPYSDHELQVLHSMDDSISRSKVLLCCLSGETSRLSPGLSQSDPEWASNPTAHERQHIMQLSQTGLFATQSYSKVPKLGRSSIPWG